MIEAALVSFAVAFAVYGISMLVVLLAVLRRPANTTTIHVTDGSAFSAGAGSASSRAATLDEIERAENTLANIANLRALASVLREIAAAADDERFAGDFPERVEELAMDIEARAARAQELVVEGRSRLAARYRGNGIGGP